MAYDLVPRGVSMPARRVPTRLNRRLSRVEEDAIVQASEIQAAQMVGRVALSAVTQLSIAQAELQNLLPEDSGARLRLAAIADATTARIQMVVLEGL